MSKKRDAYDALCDSMREKIQKAGGSRCSEADRRDMMYELLNTPDHEAEVWMKDADEPVITTPVKDYRESLKPILDQFGVDKDEQNKIMEVKFPKKHADALIKLGDQAIQDYMGVGRKLILPITDKDQSQMELSHAKKDEKRENTRKPVETSPGVYESVPTGECRITAPHTEIKASNKMQDRHVRKEKAE